MSGFYSCFFAWPHRTCNMVADTSGENWMIKGMRIRCVEICNSHLRESDEDEI